MKLLIGVMVCMIASARPHRDGRLAEALLSLLQPTEEQVGISSSDVVLGNVGVKGCPRGSAPITDARTCRSAINVSRIPEGRIDQNSNKICYKDGSGKGYNNGQNGGGASYVCKKGSGPASDLDVGCMESCVGKVAQEIGNHFVVDEVVGGVVAGCIARTQCDLNIGCMNKCVSQTTLYVKGASNGEIGHLSDAKSGAVYSGCIARTECTNLSTSCMDNCLEKALLNIYGASNGKLGYAEPPTDAGVIAGCVTRC
jgi:hypothetical protein